MLTRQAVWLLALALPLPVVIMPVVQAASVTDVQVGHAGKRYHIDLHMRLDVDADAAWRVFNDFNDLPRLNPIITQVQTWPAKGVGQVMVATVVHGCVLFFCRDVRQLQDVHIYPAAHGGRIDSVVVPDKSDFSYGVERWVALPCADDAKATCVHFTATLQPDFWLPPWLGPWLVERQMRKQSEVLARGVERQARKLRSTPAPPAAAVSAAS